MTLVSIIDNGAGSVAEVVRPTLPNTRSTSGNSISLRSMVCMTCCASPIDMPGSAVGMYRMLPSFSGGMNSLPSER